MLAAIRDIGQDGLNPADYNLAALEKLLLRQARQTSPDPARNADLDLLLTDSLIRLGYHLTFGKVDPEALPDTVVCYLDVSVGLPLLTAYALAKREPRVPKRLYDRRTQLLAALESEYRRARARD